MFGKRRLPSVNIAAYILRSIEIADRPIWLALDEYDTAVHTPIGGQIAKFLHYVNRSNIARNLP